jgi:serine phosphatase RsbU (regulator of sigma subunit)
MRPYQLPTPPQPTAVGWIASARAFLVGTWRGRILLLALAIWLAGLVGIPYAAGPSEPAAVVLWIYGIWGAWRFGRLVLVRLLWRIRTKLLVSYLFIAVVPIVLLLLLFALASLLFSGLVASYMVSTEIDRAAQVLETTARTALAGLPPEGPGLETALRERLAPARALHPDVRYILVHKQARAAGSPELPTTLPGWLKEKRFAGLVKAGDVDVLRGVAIDADSFLLLEVPLDVKTFAAFEKRTGIHLLTVGGSVTTKEGLDIRIDHKNRLEPQGKLEVSGMAFLATPERTTWETGERESDPMTFGYHPFDLVRNLSSGSLNMADILVKALAAVGVIFLVVYSIALLFGLLLARSITASIHALSVGTMQLRHGDFGHEIRVGSRDQLGELADSFNIMARGIEDLLRQTADKERLEEELRIARQIQMSLLPPQNAVTLAGLRIAALCLPAAEVGGDYYDLLPLSDTRMGVLIADVSGKGTSAALYMAELKGLVLSLSRIYDSPARLLCEANRILSAHMDSRSFVTMTYAIVDTLAGKMRYARAGHNPILHLEALTGRTKVLTPPGLGLGLDPGARFEEILEEAEAPLTSGDIFLFFTDGLSEAMNGRSELFGEQRLRDILEQSESLTSEELKERILAQIRVFVGDAAQHDDMTLVVLKVV